MPSHLARMTSNDLPDFCDLIALADALEQDSGKVRLVDTIRRAGRAQSCRADLELAKNSCEAIAQFDLPSMTATILHRQTARNALLMNAILLYARATSTGKKLGERGSTSIEDRLPPELRADHRQIVNIRDRAYAHVYANEPIGDRIWHREAIFAVRIDDEWQPASITRRIQENPKVLQQLRKLLPLADELVRGVFLKRIGELAELLNKRDHLLPLLEIHRFDAVAFLGSVEEVWRLLKSRKSGSAVGIIEG